MILFIWTLCFIQGVLGQVVVTQPEVKSTQLGQSISIDCNVDKVVHRNPAGSVSKGDYYISWYLQKADGPPKLLIYYTTMKPSETPSRMSGGGSFHSGGNGLDFTLINNNVQLEDAGVYYCMSVHEISKSWVFTFGGGTKLSVGSNSKPTLTVLPPSTDELKQGKATVMCVGSKGFPSDWKLGWKVDGTSKTSGVNLSPSVLQSDGLYSWSSSLTLTDTEWRSAQIISCEATYSSQTPAITMLNTQQCDVE